MIRRYTITAKLPHREQWLSSAFTLIGARHYAARQVGHRALTRPPGHSPEEIPIRIYRKGTVIETL